MSQLQPSPTWDVQDSTKIQCYMRCPRRYFFEYVLGWRSAEPNIDLIFGTAWHIAQAILLTEGYTADAAAKAFAAFYDYFRESFGESLDETLAPKNPSNAMRGLAQYIARYKNDLLSFTPLYVETAGCVPVSRDRVVYFKCDAIIRNSEGQHLALEHKTTTRFSTSWAAQWRMKMQLGVYSHVMHCLYPPESVYGVIVNGFFVHNAPRMKLNGEPYAGEKDNEFHRVPVRRSILSMNAWLVEVNHYLDQLELDFSLLADADEGDNILFAFKRNTEHCADFGQCPFLDHCSVWHNPLRYADAPPVGFAVNHWDPRNMPGVRETIQVQPLTEMDAS